MILRTLLFFLLIYLLIKVISRMFLPSSPNKRGKNGRQGFFYHNFGRHYEEGKRQSRNRGNKSPDRFAEIEEAEYEDITEESKSSKSSD